MKPEVIAATHARLQPHLVRTPLLTSADLNQFLFCKIYFKYEGQQITGAFKSRGVLNALLKLKEQNQLPAHVVAFSSGNHAQAVAWAAKLLGIKATIFIPEDASPFKIAATKSHGAEVIITPDRQTAEAQAVEFAKDAFLLPPYDHDDIIAGQGTAAFEAWQDEGGFDVVFAPCGGGGLISGTLLATRHFSKDAKVFGAEPLLANDAAQSLKSGMIQRLTSSPNTIADGARTLAVSPRTFQYIQQLDSILEINEEEIVYWTQWLTHLLQVRVEPTSALGMAAAYNWHCAGNYGKILIILSGSNMDEKTEQQIWQQDFLSQKPGML
jgi:threonine dehydratase